MEVNISDLTWSTFIYPREGKIARDQYQFVKENHKTQYNPIISG